jgi:hypothetical protein
MVGDKLLREIRRSASSPARQVGSGRGRGMTGADPDDLGGPDGTGSSQALQQHQQQLTGRALLQTSTLFTAAAAAAAQSQEQEQAGERQWLRVSITVGGYWAQQDADTGREGLDSAAVSGQLLVSEGGCSLRVLHSTTIHAITTCTSQLAVLVSGTQYLHMRQSSE